MIGQSISHYRVIEKLGEGGMGEVFLASDLETWKNADRGILEIEDAKARLAKLTS